MSIGSIGGIGGIGAGWEQMDIQAMRQAMFNRLDQDGDGSISKSDMEGLAQNIADNTGESIDVDQVFDNLDANQDGVIDQSEYDVAMEQFESNMQHMAGARGLGKGPPPPPPSSEDDSSDPLQALFEQLDQDGDGLISLSELQAALQKFPEATGSSNPLEKLFTELDTNQDGVIDQSEQDAAISQMAEARAENRPPPPPPAEEDSSDPIQALLERLDQDGDGVISLSEWQAAQQALTQAAGASSEGDNTDTKATSAPTDVAGNSSAFMEKLLQDFIFMVQNDAYLQLASNQKGVEAYA